MKSPLILLTRILKNETVSDFFIALAWAIFVGLPLFTLHMLVLDYEHSLHGMSIQFSFQMSLKNMIPYHPMSIGLWLVAVFITAFSLRRAFTEEMRSGLAFHGRIRGEDHLVDFTGIEQRFEFTRADLFRADAIEWRQMAMQYEVAPAETAGLLDGHHVSGGFDDAQQSRVTRRRRADGTQVGIGEHAAALATLDGCKPRSECFRECARTATTTLQQMESHALRGLRAHARQGAQRVDQFGERSRVLHPGACLERQLESGR
jgi:hypothetical protein